MKEYKKKAGTVQAVQWTGKNIDELSDFLGDALATVERRIDYKPRVYGKNMNVGDYVLQAEPKAFIVLSEEEFNYYYEVV